MAKREFPELDNDWKDFKFDAPASRGKFSAFSSKAFAIIKFLLGVCLLPFVYAVSLAFLNQFAKVEPLLENYFWQGLISFLVIYLFVWEPALVYNRGHKLVSFVFNFIKPLVKVAPYLVPIYTLVIFISYELFLLVSKSTELLCYAVFALGFSTALHLVFSAKSVRGKKGDFLKSNYLFGFSMAYILNLSLLSFLLNVIFVPFSFVAFCNQSYQIASGVFFAVLKQLFL
ncbi:MAG: hypothetical protein WC628_02200 [Candidatus Omnitrophota bacterium]